LSYSKILRGFKAYERNTGRRHPLSLGIKDFKRAVASDPLTDEQSQLWIGTISVGTPAVQYTVDFDTGSSDLFLPGSTCDSTCSGHTLYNPSASSTSTDLGTTFTLSYGDGSTVSGEQYTDTVAVAGLTATEQTLGAASQYSSGFESSNFPADGLMGMGFQSISVYNAPPVFQSLIASGQTDSPVFAMKLVSSGSELTLGGLDSSIYKGSVTYIPVSQEGYWQSTFDSLNVGGQSVVGSTACIVDSVRRHYSLLTPLFLTFFYRELPSSSAIPPTLLRSINRYLVLKMLPPPLVQDSIHSLVTPLSLPFLSPSVARTSP